MEIRDVSAVTCSGMARDNDSFARLHAKLGDDTNDISGLHAEVHGQKPMDFTLNFQWGRRPPMETKNREKLLLIVTGCVPVLAAVELAGHFAVD